MDKKQKHNFIENLLSNRFNLENFKEFTARIINTKVRERKVSDAVWKEYKDYIENYQVVGDYKDNNGDGINIIAIKIKEGDNKIINPIRARSKQRNFIAKYLDEYSKSGALVAFYNDNNPVWRLSFIKQDLSFTFEGIKKDLTPAKRSSYVVGEGEPYHTPLKQFFSYSESKETLGLEEFEEIFKLEKVTNEFFEAYKKKYLDLKEHLEKSEDFISQAKNMGDQLDKVSEAFAKKLMGQLSFLYFLQKKGWLGVKAIPTTLSFSEYTAIYNKFDDKTKEISDNVFRGKGNEIKLSVSKMEKLNNKEADLLALGFKESNHYQNFGNGEGKFIRTLFERHRTIEESHPKGRNFFNDYLEDLFYDALNESRGESQYFKKFNCRIPFLNGGLFEPEYDWKNTDFNIPDTIFSNSRKNGILDIFDLYNFTISENEPFETEVAVDPEMLGKVFENLLDIKDKKSKGAFYTPREIVHYMCKESLINYLDNELEKIDREDLEELVNNGEFKKESDLKIFNDYRKGESKITALEMPKKILKNLNRIEKVISNVKVADPAIGSGAFPLGMLNEIVKLRSIITDYFIIREWATLEQSGKLSKNTETETEARILSERNLYRLKLETIENSLYGVDIEPSAVDIAKLRMWLSIVVDAPKEDVKPLPNLDFNFMVGNSLLNEFKGIKLFDEKLLDKEYSKSKLKNIKTGFQLGMFGNFENIQEDIMSSIHKLHKKFFAEKDSIEKKKIKNEVNSLEWQLIRITLESSGNEDKIKELEKLRKDKRKPYFLWKLEFAEVFQQKGGFDIVIGNPPYVGEGKNKSIFTSVKESSFGEKYYIGKMDFWYFFTSLGLELIKTKGTLNYIAPNNWMTTFGGKKMRNHIMEVAYIKQFLNFGNYMVFENAMQQTMVFLLEKTDKNIMSIDCREVLEKNLNKNELNMFLNKLNSEKFKYYSSNLTKEKYKRDATFQFLDERIGKLTNKISIDKLYLKDKEIAQGIVPNPDIIGKRNIEKISLEERIKNNIKIGNGVFVNKIGFFNKLTLEEEKFIKPLYESENVDRYYFNSIHNKELINIEGVIKEERLPNLINHLVKYRSIMDSRRENIKGSRQYYNLHWGRDSSFFEKGEKIISMRKCINTPIFSYTNEVAYVMLTFNVIKSKRFNMKYLTSLLNSNLVAFWLKYMGKMQGSNYQIDKEPLLNIPLVQTNKITENKIVNLVDQIIELKKQEKNTSDLELEIDEMVYDLYELTEEEKDVVKNFKNR